VSSISLGLTVKNGVSVATHPPINPIAFPGLCGWFDTSQVGGVINDNGDFAADGDNVSAVLNLYKSGSYIMPDLYQDDSANYPTFHSSVQYGYNTGTGAFHTGIQGGYLKIDDFGFGVLTNPPAVLTWFYAARNISNHIDPIFFLSDQQSSVFCDLVQYSGTASSGRGSITGLVVPDYNIVGSNTGSVSPEDNTFVQCGYVDGTNINNVRTAALYMDSTGAIRINNSGSTGNNFLFSSFASQAKSSNNTYDSPWLFMNLLTDSQGTNANTPFGELLVYAGNVLPQNQVAFIMNYLSTKWA
jgi:hypothetical protein